jgi:hypothetical protein
MGQIAHQAIGYDMCAIGFTAYEGARAADSPIEPTRDTVEFEDLMRATGLEYGASRRSQAGEYDVLRLERHGVRTRISAVGPILVVSPEARPITSGRCAFRVEGTYVPGSWVASNRAVRCLHRSTLDSP